MTRLPDERDMEQAVRSWMRDDGEHPADRNRQVGRIMGRIDETRQRRHVWQRLPFWHGRRRVDEADDELYATGPGAMAWSAVGAIAVLALVVTALAFLLAPRVSQPPAPAASPSPSPTAQPTMVPADAALFARLEDVWSGERSSFADVREIYAEDAVHTALWQDRVDRVIGPQRIWERVQASGKVESGDRIRLPDAANGAHRYLGASKNFGGTPCVFWIEDERITRHDCILPADSTSPTTPDFPPASPDTLELWEIIKADFLPGWAKADRELIARVVSPDIVHKVVLNNHDYTLRGIDLYMDVMYSGSAPEELAQPVALPAPAGEARWTDYNDVGGGSLCTFWARDGLIVRHDCVVPTSMSSQLPPATPEPTQRA